MTEAVEHLQAGLLALPVPNGWIRTLATTKETEFLAELPGGRLEIEESRGFVTICFGWWFWEDIEVRTIRDADRVLAACDAILDGRLTEARAGNWLFRSVVARLDLSTRGFEETWGDERFHLFREPRRAPINPASGPPSRE